MKNTLLFLVLMVSGFSLLIQRTSAAPVEPVRELFLNYVWAIPVIDGIRDNSYGEVQTTNIFNPTGYDGEADFSAVFCVVADYEYLYVHAEITDDVNHSYEWNVGNPWEFDNIELFLQLDTNTMTTGYDSATVQLRICRSLDSVESPGHASRSDYLYYMEADAAGGWITEVAVPWTAVLPESIESIYDYKGCSGVLGFDFSAADSDNTDGDASVGNRNVQSAWDDDDPADESDRTEDLAWNNTSVFGYLYYNMCGSTTESPGGKNQVTLFPNPAENTLQLEPEERSCHLLICNMQGMKVMEKEFLQGEELDISGLPAGMYTVLIDGKSSGKFIKR
ncbi:MAG: T9SS type A sorting domain-containing protein [Bacteroidales bacterium]|nr:T9SS type A sorting domain-containing protein [Bacteroidales bacterium]